MQVPPDPGSPEEVLAYLTTLYPERNAVLELRALGVPQGRRTTTFSGFFDDFSALARDAVHLDQQGATGIYVTLNPVNPALLARCSNKVRMAEKGGGTQDKDIVERKFLFVDIDADRPSGISATREEKGSAAAVLKDVVLWAEEQGLPYPTVADSGNGFHLLWRLKEEAETEGHENPKKDRQKLIQSFLHYLDFRFAQRGVLIDPSVVNPSRIIRLYGTHARKGEDTESRPHRRARILRAGDTRPISWSNLHALHKMSPRASGLKRDEAKSTQLDMWLHRHQVPAHGPIPWANLGRKWVFSECPWDKSHTDSSAYIVQLHAGGIAAGCHHEDCPGNERDSKNRALGWRKLQKRFGKLGSNPTAATTAAAPSTTLSPGLTDLGNAKRLVRHYGEDLRFVGDWNKWVYWTGLQWKQDDDLPYHLATNLSTFIFAESNAAKADDPDKATLLKKFALRAESKAAMQASVGLAKVDPKLRAEGVFFDRNHHLLSTPTTAIDLRSGVLLDHDRSHGITCLTNVSYQEEAECPQWEEFVHWMMSGNEALIDYMQRLVGYFATGEVQEQVLVFFVGDGANGKTTFINVLLKCLGANYASPVPATVLVRSNVDQHPTHVADLRGKRLGVVSELDRSSVLNEGLVKQLTGSDQIKARFMRKDFFNFDPTHKLCVLTNHKPLIRGTDHGVWRRIHLVPFEQTISEDKMDFRLEQKLLDEGPGILNWIIEGAKQWYEQGLCPPEEVRAAVEKYRKESDWLGEFLEERTAPQDQGRLPVMSLYAAYQEWAEDRGEKVYGARSFSKAVRERGYEKIVAKEKVGSTWRSLKCWRGLRLVSVFDGADRSPKVRIDPNNWH